MERLRGKIKTDVPVAAELQVKKRHPKAPKTPAKVETRQLDILIREFKDSSGNFEQFHSTMNGREKILFKGYINSMRDSEM